MGVKGKSVEERGGNSQWHIYFHIATQVPLCKASFVVPELRSAEIQDDRDKAGTNGVCLPPTFTQEPAASGRLPLARLHLTWKVAVCSLRSLLRMQFVSE